MTRFTKQKTTRIQNQDGFAMLESLPLLIVFLVLAAYGIGFFGFIHTGILNSISARTYLFEVLGQRANTNFFRDDPTSNVIRYAGNRLSGISSERRTDDSIMATNRRIAIGLDPAKEGDNSPELHNEKIFEIYNGKDIRNTKLSVSPGWVMSQFGICLDATCNDI